jgi:hypothetical protein
MRMNEPAGAAGSPIPAEVIPQLAAPAAQIAAACEEPAPASIAAAPTTRVNALEVLFNGSTVPASHDAPSYAVVMTGHFASYQGPHSRLAKLPPRRRGRCLVAVIDAATLMPTDATMHDQDDTGLLAQLGPVAILTRETPGASQNPLTCLGVHHERYLVGYSPSRDRTFASMATASTLDATGRLP